MLLGQVVPPEATVPPEKGDWEHKAIAINQ